MEFLQIVGSIPAERCKRVWPLSPFRKDGSFPSSLRNRPLCPPLDMQVLEKCRMDTAKKKAAPILFDFPYGYTTICPGPLNVGSDKTF